MQPAVFLDRDNTLIVNDGDLGDPEGVVLADGVAAGLKALREAGFRLIVVTNQGGVARGKYTEADVDAVHQRIAQVIDEAAGQSGLVDRFYYCPYHPKALVPEYRRDHPWRKPHAGMLLQAARDMGLDLARSWLIGDQERDVAAGRSAGCRTVLIGDNGAAATIHPTVVASNFSAAVQAILKQHEPRPPAEASPPTPRRPERPGAAGESQPTVAPAVAEPIISTNPATSTRELGEGSSAQRAIRELADEIRSDRLRRAEFTPLRMIAAFGQLLAVLLALLGLLQMANMEVFAKWMVGAALMQLLTITALVADLKS